MEGIPMPNGTKGDTRRQFLKVTAAGASAGMLAGCSALLGGDDDTITIAGLQPYSGPFALYGDAHTAGIEFAIDEINDDGGVLDRELEHDAVDTESNPSEANTALTGLADEGAVAAVGPVSSDVGVAVSETAESQEIPLFLHAAGDVEILDHDSNYTFRTGLPPSPAFIQAQEGLVEEREFENLGAITADYAWGIAAEQAIEESFPDAELETAPTDESDFFPYLTDMSADLDLLIGSGHSPGINDMFQDLMATDEPDPDLFTAAVSPPESNYEAIGDDIENGFTFGHLPDVYSDEYQEVADEFYDETGDYFGPTQALGYVTVQLIAEAIEQEESDDPAVIADAMSDIEVDTLFAEPVQYTDWGELDQFSLIWSGFELEAPDYYPDGDFDLHEEFRTEPMDAIDPDDYT